MMIVFAKPCTNCLRVALGLIFIITIIQRWTVKNVVHCVKVSPARHKKKQQKNHPCEASPRHSADGVSCVRHGSVRALSSEVSDRPAMSSLEVIKGEMRSRPPGPEVQTRVAPQLLSLHTVQCWHDPDAFVFGFGSFCFAGIFTDTVKVAIGPPLSLRWPPLFLVFLHSTHFFRHIYNFCYSWCLSVLHSCNYIYFWCSSTWQTCLMCTIFS